MSESLLKPEQVGHAAAGKTMISDGTRFHAADPAGAGISYLLPICGPIVGISGASFLAITQPVTMLATPVTNGLLSFYWEAGDAGVNARWRLRNVSASVTILSGLLAAPFSWTLVSDSSAGTMPTQGDEVELQVAFSAVNLGGTIDLRGPATWRVS